MKKTLRISFASLLIALVCTLSASAATTPGDHGMGKGKKAITKQTTAVKESKKFTDVFYTYNGTGDITVASNYTFVSGGDPCAETGTKLCSISFDNSFTINQAVAQLSGVTTFHEGDTYGTSPIVTIHTKN